VAWACTPLQNKFHPQARAQDFTGCLLTLLRLPWWVGGVSSPHLWTLWLTGTWSWGRALGQDSGIIFYSAPPSPHPAPKGELRPFPQGAALAVLGRSPQGLWPG
jgi:hypothetical protein